MQEHIWVKFYHKNGNVKNPILISVIQKQLINEVM